jgi:hypothetical protein
MPLLQSVNIQTWHTAPCIVMNDSSGLYKQIIKLYPMMYGGSESLQIRNGYHLHIPALHLNVNVTIYTVHRFIYLYRSEASLLTAKFWDMN